MPVSMATASALPGHRGHQGDVVPQEGRPDSGYLTPVDNPETYSVISEDTPQLPADGPANDVMSSPDDEYISPSYPANGSERASPFLLPEHVPLPSQHVQAGQTATSPIDTYVLPSSYSQQQSEEQSYTSIPESCPSDEYVRPSLLPGDSVSSPVYDSLGDGQRPSRLILMHNQDSLQLNSPHLYTLPDPPLPTASPTHQPSHTGYLQLVPGEPHYVNQPQLSPAHRPL